MRVAIISDIHGNCFALDKALDDLRPQGVDRTVCLGDAIQGGPEPAQVVARLREMECPVVMGNADAWLLSGINTSTVEEVTERQLKIREWSLSQLSDADRAYIETFQPTIEVPLGGRNLLCFHGSPYSFDDIILPETPEEEFRRFLDAFEPAIMTGGHTHMQQVRRLADTFFFNPGSIGFAYNRYQPEGYKAKADAWAEYAILSSEGDTLSLEFRRVPFDPNDYVRIILSSGIPYAEGIADRYR